MSPGWSWLWKDEQDSSFHHTLCLQVKSTCKLTKILTLTSGLKIPGPLCDNWGPFKTLRSPTSAAVGCGAFKPVFLSAWRRTNFYGVWRRTLTHTGPLWLAPNAPQFVKFSHVPKSCSQGLKLYKGWRGLEGYSHFFPEQCSPWHAWWIMFSDTEKNNSSFRVKTQSCLTPYLPQVQNKCET